MATKEKQAPPAKPKKGEKEAQSVEGSRLGREVLGLCAIFCGLLVILSLASFDSRDPWINHSLSNVSSIYNKAGEFGAFVSGSLFDIFGFAAWLVPAFFCLAGVRRILGAQVWAWWRWAGFLLFGICLCMFGAAADMGAIEFFPRGGVIKGSGDVSVHGGGIIGHMLYDGLVNWMGLIGTLLVWICLFLLSVQIFTGISWSSLIRNTGLFFLRCLQEIGARTSDNYHIYKEARMIRAEQRALAASSTMDVEALPSNGKSAVFSSKALASPVEITGTEEIRPKGRDYSGPREEKSLDEADFSTLFPEDRQQTEDDPEGESPAASPQEAERNSLFKLPRFSFGKNTKPEPEYKTDDSEMPPWVLDFEQGRLGVQSNPAVDGSVAECGPSPFEDVTAKKQADGSKAQPQVQPAASTRQAVSQTSADTKEEEPLDVPIYQAKPIAQVSGANKAGFVDSVLNRMKKSASIPLPSLELLSAPSATAKTTPRSVLENKGKSLMTCLNDFNIMGELVGITPGPVVTMFEVRPAPGVRVSRIANLSDDLALALKAVAVRIQAPVPGTDTVGIEIPNEIRETVALKELLSSQLFNKSKSLLTLALGKDIAGNPAVADLATMPHLLVAGATGAGKSVGINSIILSLIFKARPHEVKLLLIDPKRVEMAVYSDLPHLVHPVVTEMQLAKNALEWAVAEMEERYNAIARAGVRNISDYNAKVASFGKNVPEGMEDLQPIPYLVVIIDELADLMLVAAKEVETSIVRLAQLARAAGIHLILATQRPSVDVVTGLIKANFPCRISFQVTSKHDSRTILDSVGAEHLLGRGDMLFKPGGGKFQRLHGAFVSDDEVHGVVKYWKSRQKPEYHVDFSEWAPEGSGPVFTNGGGGGGGDVASDPLYTEAVDFVRQQGKASISLIQRKFRIGFNKAARFVEQMEQDGLIGPADGSKPRLVIR